MRNIGYFLSKVIISAVFCIIAPVTYATIPLWTLTPTPGSQITQTVLENMTGTVQYVVQNESSRSKRLVVVPVAGLTQTSSCQLTPKGTNGSSCILNIVITGNDLPPNGIHGGPVLCLANPDGSPNSNQCYQPPRAYSLNISKSFQPGLVVTGQPLTLSPNCSTFSTLTVTNVSSNTTANNISIDLGSLAGNVLIGTNTCSGANLAPKGSCSFELRGIGATTAPANIVIQGSNTPPENASIWVHQLVIGEIYQQGVVFQVDACNLGKVVTTLANQYTSLWTATDSDITAATDLNNGAANTDAIVLNSACTANTNGCAAYRCQNLGGVSTPLWYLPALNELQTVASALCPGGNSCPNGIFDTAFYWTSSQLNITTTRVVAFPSGTTTGLDKNVTARRTRCIRTFTP